MSDLLEKVKIILVDEIGLAEDFMSVESKLKDDLGADSLDAIEIIMTLIVKLSN